MKTITFQIKSKRPLLMNSDKLSDPLNPLTKAHKQLTAKRKKTDEDHELIAKSQWVSSLYLDKDGPYIPGVMVEACLISGGKLSKLGAQLKRSVEVLNDKCPLVYEGPKDVDSLWEAGFYDARSVKVQQARVMRYRPIFHHWGFSVEMMFDEETINEEQLVKCLEDGGTYCGIGDYRPKFGRFFVEVL